jgi:predicted nuclease of predicted toxin-antitoxin system
MPRHLVAALRSDGHDVISIAEWSKDPGDEEIMALAYREERVVITRDKDFGGMVVFRQVKHCGILQLRKIPLSDQPNVCRQALAKHESDLMSRAIVTVQPGQIRVRKG